MAAVQTCTVPAPRSDRAQLRQHFQPDGTAAGRGFDGRPRRDLGRLVGIAVEFRDGAEAAAGPRGVRIANVVDEKIVEHGRTIRRKRFRMQA